MDHKKLKAEVKDKLNEIAILLKDVDPDWQYENIWSDDENKHIINPNHSEDAEYLVMVQHATTSLLRDDGGDLEQFYSSFCY